MDILQKVKEGWITGNQFDTMLNDYITEVKSYLQSAGVDPARLETEECAGIIRRGVSDLWDNDSGKVVFSPYFDRRAAQLALKGRVNNDV